MIKANKNVNLLRIFETDFTQMIQHFFLITLTLQKLF